MPGRSHVTVPHLNGTIAAYQTSGDLDATKPTLVMVNSFLTNSNLYGSQYANKNLTDRMNLIAIELLGHGETRTKSEHWTYWDTAIMNIQVLEALQKRGEIAGKVFVLGTSQGGWITTRMALLAPEMVCFSEPSSIASLIERNERTNKTNPTPPDLKILILLTLLPPSQISGIIPLGTSMDYESATTRSLGCWDAPSDLTDMIDSLTNNDPAPDSFTLPLENADFLIDIGFGKDSISPSDRAYWREQIQTSYAGDEGRRRARMAAINLRDRDGLHGRLWDVRCPVLWLHGTADAVYSVKNAEREIEKFANAPWKELRVVEGGEHFLSFSHPSEVDGALVEFVERWA